MSYHFLDDKPSDRRDVSRAGKNGEDALRD